jgi:hypothetical protein
VTASAPVIIRQHIYSEAVGAVGIFCQEITRNLPAVPRHEDWIELADGWSSAMVRDVTFLVDGRVLAELKNVKTDSPEVVEEHHRLVDEHGWSWIGPPPARGEQL